MATTYEAALEAALQLTRAEQEQLIEALEDAIDVADYLEIKRAIEAGEETTRPIEEAFADYQARNPEPTRQAS